MKSKLILVLVTLFSATCFSTFLSVTASAMTSSGLTIDAAEVGVAKFHRYDNHVHPYGASNAWLPYVLPENAPTDQATTINNPDGSVSIFFMTLDDLLNSVIRVADQRHQPVTVLNIHGHGLPGGMWFPANVSFQQSIECSSWNDAASGSDKDNYDQYYSPVGASEIDAIREMSQTANYRSTCTTGLSEWQAEVAKTPQFKSVLAADAQVHFLSCVVGLGEAGRAFTEGVAKLLFPDGHGAVETSVDFGLGDWSMPRGMGFWDMQSSAQLEHDNDIYPKDRKDSEIAQKGTIRLVMGGISGWHSRMMAEQSFMTLGFDSDLHAKEALLPEATGKSDEHDMLIGSPNLSSPETLPWRIRVPGTSAYVYRK